MTTSLEMGIGCKLTSDLILKRSRCNRMDSLKALNCWGCNLTDVSILREFPALRVLILTTNCISDLTPLSQCVRLRELYLRNNKIEDIQELNKLSHLKNLRSIWISDNPCTSNDTVNYAAQVCEILPRVKYLDGQPIESLLEEKKKVERLEPSNLFRAVSILIEDMDGEELLELQRAVSLKLSLID